VFHFKVASHPETVGRVVEFLEQLVAQRGSRRYPSQQGFLRRKRSIRSDCAGQWGFLEGSCEKAKPSVMRETPLAGGGGYSP